MNNKLIKTMSNKRDEWSHRCANRLFILVTKTMGRIVKKTLSWTKEFTTLRASLSGNEQENEAVVDKTLSWLEQNWKSLTHPVISANGFSRRWEELSTRASSTTNGAAHEGSNNKQGVPSHQLSDICSDAYEFLKSRDIDVDEVIAQVHDLGLPKIGNRGQREAVIISCRLIYDVIKVLWSIYNEGDGVINDAAHDVMSSLHRSPTEATVLWFVKQLDQIKRWKEWNGSWKPFCFSVDHKKFLELVDKNTPDVKRADKLLKIIKERLAAADVA